MSTVLSAPHKTCEAYLKKLSCADWSMMPGICFILFWVFKLEYNVPKLTPKNFVQNG